MRVSSLVLAAACFFSIGNAEPVSRGSREAFAAREYFYVGGGYVNTGSGHLFSNQMYVEKLTPLKPRQAYPLVFIHGQAQTGTVSAQLQTKDVG